ncbi:hypothetical protein L3X38_043496 [Prunus dulcis]|uniref:E3 ubiquitin-protein ligase RMA n=1 Tax=Prunus dulcis TaxID=3755 RepID=A0AAD4YMA9_PRUDU|nr:hypothetical protein L3X38_043496 [Prunus dulcis]
MDVDMEINTVGENSFSSSDDARDDHACGFKCNICLELADQDPIVTPCGHLYCWPCLYRWLRVCSSQSNKLQCPACTTVIKEKKLIPIYGIESDRRSPSVPPGFKIPNRPSPSSSSSNRRSVRQIRNAVASAFSAPFSSSSIGQAVRQTLNAIASALNANHFSKVFEFMPMVLGGIGVVVLVGGYIWCIWELCDRTNQALDSVKEVLDSVKQVLDSVQQLCDSVERICQALKPVCDCIEATHNGWKKVKAMCSLGLRVVYCLI